MTARNVSPETDPVHPDRSTAVEFEAGGEPVTAIDGQSIAAALLVAGHPGWRTTSRAGRQRGLFCGIGVCFDCLVTVNGIADVRACQRRAESGDRVAFQDHRPDPPERGDHG